MNWISVFDKMPTDKDEYVLVWGKESGHVIAHHDFIPSKDATSGFLVWMELPKPPSFCQLFLHVVNCWIKEKIKKSYTL